MNLLVRSTVLVFAMTGCFLDHSDDPDPGTPDPGSSGGNGGGGGSRPVEHGEQTMSDVHVQPGGEQVWIIHSAVADVHASTKVTTAHFGAYLPQQNQFIEVLDTTGTLGKRILFPTKDRVLFVGQRGENLDVFVSIDTVTHRPLAQRSYPGDHTNFRVSPSGRALTTTSMAPTLDLLDTQTLVLQPLPATITFRDSVWASQSDLLYVIDLVGDLTRLQRFDLRTADPSKFGPVPEHVSTVPGTGFALAISPDDHFAAIALRDAANVAKVTLVDLTVADPTPITVACDGLPVFTSDNRLVAWQPNADNTHDLRLITPATGAATAPLKIEYELPPASIPLRTAPALLAQPFPFEDKPPFLYNTATGARTPVTGPLFPSSWFERPGHNELWLWEEYEDTLSRLDLTTGVMTEMLRDVDSVDYRAATDDIIVGTFDHSVFRLSMATGAVTSPFILADPNEVAAPFKLATD